MAKVVAGRTRPRASAVLLPAGHAHRHGHGLRVRLARVAELAGRGLSGRAEGHVSAEIVDAVPYGDIGEGSGTVIDRGAGEGEDLPLVQLPVVVRVASGVHDRGA